MKGVEDMREYKIGSAAYKRQKETQKKQREAEARRAAAPWTPKKGQKFLHPERRRNA